MSDIKVEASLERNKETKRILLTFALPSATITIDSELGPSGATDSFTLISNLRDMVTQMIEEGIY